MSKREEKLAELESFVEDESMKKKLRSMSLEQIEALQDKAHFLDRKVLEAKRKLLEWLGELVEEMPFTLLFPLMIDIFNGFFLSQAQEGAKQKGVPEAEIEKMQIKSFFPHLYQELYEQCFTAALDNLWEGEKKGGEE